MNLSDMAVGQSGRVVMLKTYGTMRRRFMDLGLVVGADIKCVGISPPGDPKAYSICGAVIAIRKEDGDGVEIVLSDNRLYTKGEEYEIN